MRPKLVSRFFNFSVLHSVCYDFIRFGCNEQVLISSIGRLGGFACYRRGSNGTTFKRKAQIRKEVTTTSTVQVKRKKNRNRSGEARKGATFCFG